MAKEITIETNYEVLDREEDHYEVCQSANFDDIFEAYVEDKQSMNYD